MPLLQLIRAWRKCARVIRGVVWSIGIRASGGTCGPGLQVEPGCTLRWGPHPGIQIGANVTLGRGVIIDIPGGAHLLLGDRVKIMHHCVIAAFERIAIGEGSQIGEMCSIRDSDHGSGTGETPMSDDNVSSPTRIGRGVWIARGVAVLRGSDIADEAVVGANSVVVAKYPVPARARVVGAPAKARLTS